MAGYQMPIHRPKCQFVAGIDPDKDTNGIVVYDRQEKAWLCGSCDQHSLLKMITKRFTKEEIEIMVEAGWQNKSFFHLDQMPEGWEDWNIERAFQYVAGIAIKVGMNFGFGQSTVHLLIKMGYKVTEVKPVTAKWDAHLFKRKTGLKHGYSETVRDACRTMWDFR